MKRTYYEPQSYTKNEVKNILSRNKVDELVYLGIDVGMNCLSWKFAQDLCLNLAEHENDVVRANAVLGLAHIARTQKRLEKHLVKPVILRELRNNNENKSKISDAIEDINHFMDWSIGLKQMKKSRSQDSFY